MKTIIANVVLIALLIGAGLLVFTRTAEAAHVLSVTSISGQAVVGKPVEFQVSLRSVEENRAVPNATVRAYTDAAFVDVSGEVELGSAVTDENGVAVLTFKPRSAGEQEIRVEYLPPGESQPELAATTISVAGAAQLHQSHAGVSIPGLNVWLIMLILSGIWAILFSVGMRVVAIASSAGELEPLPESQA